MKNKKLIFWGALICVNLALAGVIAGVYYYRVRYLPRKSFLSAIEKVEKAQDPEGIGIWRADKRLGFSHINNSSGAHKTEDFEVRYTIGADGERYIPVPENPKGRVLFLGGSLTFGHGVEDGESFSAVLAKEHWSDFEVVNKGVMGWGTSHAYLTLIDELESSKKLDMVIYSYIPGHSIRNYLRRNWIEILERYQRKHPHFELVDGELSFQGVVGLDKSLEYSKALKKKELELTVAFLVSMQELCLEKNIPFVVVLLPKLYPMQKEVIEALRDNRILSLDISKEQIERFKNDTHPNVDDHRRIAESISKSFITGRLIRKQGN